MLLLLSVGLAASAGAQTYNAALNQRAFMSSTNGDQVASLANDGDHSTASLDCAYTESDDSDPWWAVDLGAPSRVVEVKYTIVDITTTGI